MTSLLEQVTCFLGREPTEPTETPDLVSTVMATNARDTELYRFSV